MTDTHDRAETTTAGHSEGAADQLGELLAALGATADESSTEVQSDAQRRDTVQLIRDIAMLIPETPGAVTTTEPFTPFLDAISQALDTDTRRLAAEALFVAAGQRPAPIAERVETVRTLLGDEDSAVQAWSVAAVGRLAASDPDAAGSVADAVYDLLDHDNETVQHNAVEALATLARDRPDAVAPAGPRLRGLLDHDDVAIQHNVTGTLGVLAATHSEVVVPAAETIAGLTHHDEEDVRNVARGTLARLAEERPGAVESMTE